MARGWGPALGGSRFFPLFLTFWEFFAGIDWAMARLLMVRDAGLVVPVETLVKKVSTSIYRSKRCTFCTYF
jgi:hypothetical protein